MEILAEGATALGLPLTGAQLAQFQAYYEMLADWNTRVNLTAITDPVGVQTRHFLDALAVAAALPAPTEGNARLIDLGTGAGLPGLPLKILWPGIGLTLVDSVGKKTVFLRAVVETLGLVGVTVLTTRAEELGHDRAHRAAYDVVTARGVAALSVLAEYGLPLCRVGGMMLAPKKGDLAAELATAARAMPKLGGGEISLYRYALPGETKGRVVVRLPKAGPTPSGYPRRVGLPSSRPLGK